MEIREMQKKIYQNKVNHNFNLTDLNYEFCLLYGEVGEAYDALNKHKEDYGSELADIAIYLMGIAEISKIDLQSEIEKKMAINEKRVYVNVNGAMLKKDTIDNK